MCNVLLDALGLYMCVGGCKDEESFFIMYRKKIHYVFIIAVNRDGGRESTRENVFSREGDKGTFIYLFLNNTSHSFLSPCR